ncbi:MAG: hypothetical protein EZS28_014048 [Streblomastix strix]|uniref:Uncharacterized protein n=1 Tax=Streblomastix strix TaxID=222440 RepID=A0A5J4W7A8_9EUKA|nr:MAG: hypothetical protein EZS28_014048 [Streblomastix strix]
MKIGIGIGIGIRFIRDFIYIKLLCVGLGGFLIGTGGEDYEDEEQYQCVEEFVSDEEVKKEELDADDYDEDEDQIDVEDEVKGGDKGVIEKDVYEDDCDFQVYQSWI